MVLRCWVIYGSRVWPHPFVESAATPVHIVNGRRLGRHAWSGRRRTPRAHRCADDRNSPGRTGSGSTAL